jgi:phage/plasmid-like protein (TIGR03299 family)
MSAEVETFAYNKAELPWHGLGIPVEANLTPKQIQKVAKLNWTVEKVPCYAIINGKKTLVARQALIRNSDNSILDIVSDDWNPVQNDEAFEFFTEYCKEGEMTMETAGSLRNGQIVFGLAKINEAFDLFKGNDKIQSYMLFTNPHKYGWSTSVSFTPIRVVCMNTLCLSLSTTTNDKIVRVNHRKEFIAEEAKKTLGIARKKLSEYKERAQLLSTRKANQTDIVEYFKHLFPVLSKKEEPRELSLPAKKLLETVTTQPGAEFGEGTWWQPYNAVTFYLDHEAGRTQDSRLTSAWFGAGRKLKVKALNEAVTKALCSATV